MRKRDKINLGWGVLVSLFSICAALGFQSFWVGAIVFIAIAAVFSSNRIFQ
jgi:hypothetical protein